VWHQGKRCYWKERLGWHEWFWSKLFLTFVFTTANPITKGTRWALVIFYKIVV
jgi:hypothetical protein